MEQAGKDLVEKLVAAANEIVATSAANRLVFSAEDWTAINSALRKLQLESGAARKVRPDGPRAAANAEKVDRNARILELFDERHSAKRIAEETGISEGRATQIIRSEVSKLRRRDMLQAIEEQFGPGAQWTSPEAVAWWKDEYVRRYGDTHSDHRGYMVVRRKYEASKSNA